MSEIEDDLEIELPGRPEEKLPDVDTSGWLFDSERDYETSVGLLQAAQSSRNIRTD